MLRYTYLFYGYFPLTIFSIFNFQFSIFWGVPAKPSGFPLYLCSLHSRLAPKNCPRHFGRLSDLVPVSETSPRHARKGCRSNP